MIADRLMTNERKRVFCFVCLFVYKKRAAASVQKFSFVGKEREIERDKMVNRGLSRRWASLFVC